MLVSELVQELIDFVAEYGDMDVYQESWNYSSIHPTKEVQIYLLHEWETACEDLDKEICLILDY